MIDIEIAGYASGETRIDSARLQTTGTRGAHTLRLAARGEAFDALGAGARRLERRRLDRHRRQRCRTSGRYAFTLQAAGAAAPRRGARRRRRWAWRSPQQIALQRRGDRAARPAASASQSLNKNGARWSSKGAATGVPLNYLAQFSPALRDNMRGDLALGARLGARPAGAAAAGGAPQLAGMVHVFREKGDLIVGADVPVVLGLRTLDLRADVAGGALRTRLDVDGTRAGSARVDATAQLVNGRLGNASPLRLTANADMALDRLDGAPGRPAGAGTGRRAEARADRRRHHRRARR